MDEKSRDRLFDALMHAIRPSTHFRDMLAAGELAGALPELAECVGVAQNPVYHPEGDVFEHTMLVVDCAAELRHKAKNPPGFMLAALTHDLGKAPVPRCSRTERSPPMAMRWRAGPSAGA